MNLNDLQYFVAAVEAGGFAAAARRLGLPKSTLSKRVAALEAALGVRLIHRSSRRFALTELGRDFHERARAALVEAEAAEALVRAQQAEPAGRVRLTAAVPVAQELLAPALPRLAARYPRLLLDLEVTDRFVDLVQEGFDLAIRSHRGPLPDSGLVQRRLAEERVVLVAAPDYLARQGTPLGPEDLAAHDGLLAGSGPWRLEGPEGGLHEAAPRPRFLADESTALLAAATAGLGIAALPERYCRAALAAGRVARVLPGWHAGRIATTLLLPHRRGLLPAVRATVEFLAAELA